MTGNDEHTICFSKEFSEFLRQNGIKEIESLKALRIEEEKTKKTIEAGTSIKGITPEIESLLSGASKKYGIPDSALKALAGAESNFDN